MASGITYTIIRVSGDIAFYYDEIENEPYGVTWDATNTFVSEDSVPPPDEASPLYIRLTEGGTISYFRKTLSVPASGAAFRIEVSVGGIDNEVYGLYYYPAEWMSVAKESGRISIKVKKNNEGNNRGNRIVLSNDFRKDDKVEIYVNQEHTPYSITVVGGEYSDCDTSTRLSYTGNDVSYTFDTLTDKTDCPSETVTFNITTTGGGARFSMKNTEEYSFIEDLTGSTDYFTHNGKWYKRCYSVDGDYDKPVVVRAGKAYERVVYDGALKTDTDKHTYVTVTNNGRAYMSENNFYRLVLAHRDDFNIQCVIELRYSD